MRLLSFSRLVGILGAFLVLEGAVAGCSDRQLPQRSPSSRADDDEQDENDTSSSGSSGVSSSGEPGSSSGQGGSSSSSSSSTGGPRAPGSLRVVNFNVRNLLNDVKDSTSSLETVLTPAEYQAHLADVAAALADLDGDVVLLVEVENLAVLDDLRARPEIAGVYQHASILPSNDPRGISIGLLSKEATIDETVTHRSDSIRGETGNYRYARDVPEFHVTFKGHPMVLLGVHFKAKEADDPTADNDKRLAEARGARAIADSLLAADSTRPVLLLGDFNDDTPSASSTTVANGPPAFDGTVESGFWTVMYGGVRMTYDDQYASPGFAALRDAASVRVTRFADVSDHSAVSATYNFE